MTAPSCPSTPASSTAIYAYPTGNITGSIKTLGDAFVHWKEKFVIYGDYCANLTKAQNLVEELCSKNDLFNQEIMVLYKIHEND